VSSCRGSITSHSSAEPAGTKRIEGPDEPVPGPKVAMWLAHVPSLNLKYLMLSEVGFHHVRKPVFDARTTVPEAAQHEATQTGVTVMSASFPSMSAFIAKCLKSRS